MQKKYIILLTFLVLSVLILFIRNSFPFNFISSSARGIFSSPKSVLTNVKTSAYGNDSDEVKRLKKENETLTKKFVDYERMKNDNVALRSQFESASASVYKQLPTRVIGFIGGYSDPTALIIDQGENSKIRRGMAVVIGSNLIGEIGTVTDSYSKILLLRNTEFSTVGITAENQAQGIIRGQNDFILLDRVDTLDKLIKGETVLTKGELDSNGVGIPEGLIIGKIASVYKNQTLPFQTAKIVSSIMPSKLSTVFVILGL